MEETFDLKELEDVEENLGKKLDYVRFTFCDLNGIARGVVVPRNRLPKALEDGVFCSAGALTMSPRGRSTFTDEIIEINCGNCNYFAKPQTLIHLPWAGKRKDVRENENRQRAIGQVLCESAWNAPYRNGARMESCPRYILRRQLDRLDKLGYVLKSAFEVEFTVFDKKTDQPVFSGFDDSSTLYLSQFENLLYCLDENLQSLGIKTQTILIEHGEGQFEFALDISDGVKSADALFNAKQAIKEICLQRGLQATFMSKPTKYSSSNGLHFNASLWEKYADGTLKNAFYDAADKHGLSLLHKYWIAGLLRHGKALSAIYSPTYNCYRRLHKLVLPDKIDWGIDDKIASFLAKSYSPTATYCENRVPSGASNPYLVVAASIIAGLDGILNRLDIQPSRSDNWVISDEISVTLERHCSERDEYFPYSLSEALDELEKDEVMKEGLGEEFIRWFVQMKREHEVIPFESLDYDICRWDKEKDMYFTFI